MPLPPWDFSQPESGGGVVGEQAAVSDVPPQHLHGGVAGLIRYLTFVRPGGRPSLVGVVGIRGMTWCWGSTGRL